MSMSVQKQDKDLNATIVNVVSNLVTHVAHLSKPEVVQMVVFFRIHKHARVINL